MSIWYQRFRLSELHDTEEDRKRAGRILTEEARKRALIGRSHWQARLQKIPDNLEFKAKIQGYIDDMPEMESSGHGLILFGPLGSGKTSIGTIILRNALARGARALSIRSTDMIDKLCSKHQHRLPNGAPLIEGLHNVNYLLLDELEPEDKDWRERKLESVLRHRYSEDLPTIITTNMSRKELFAIRWLKSLLSDKAKYSGIPIDGINWRAEPPKE